MSTGTKRMTATASPPETLRIARRFNGPFDSGNGGYSAGLAARSLGAGEGHHVVPLDHFADATDFEFDDREGCFDLVVNASPLGMDGQPPLALDFSHVPPGSVVYDIVTNPLDTPLLQEARASGLHAVDGYSMLIGQAAAAFEKFFGAAPPRDDGDADLRRILEQ